MPVPPPVLSSGNPCPIIQGRGFLPTFNIRQIRNKDANIINISNIRILLHVKNIKHLIFPTPPNIYCLCPKYQTKTKTCQHTEFLKSRKQMAMSCVIKSFLLISRSNASNEVQIFTDSRHPAQEKGCPKLSFCPWLCCRSTSRSLSRQSKRVVRRSPTWLFISEQQATPASALAA